MVCALACINLNDISKYDEAGAEKEPNGKDKLDALTGAKQAFEGRRKMGAGSIWRGLFWFILPFKEILKRDSVFRETLDV